MPEKEVTIARPQRWDVPFGEEMTDADVASLLTQEPFRGIDPAQFPAMLPLKGILRNDTRIVKFENGDLIVREGDYGSSAFLILRGHVRVALSSLQPELLGREPTPKKNWFRLFAQLRNGNKPPEVRSAASSHWPEGDGLGLRSDSGRVFLQDVPRLLESTRTVQLGAGEIFGELAALTRSPRTATVFAEGEVELLEIRWQGLRDLMKRTPAIREHVEKTYRENSLRVHLRETPLVKDLPPPAMERVAAATQFESFGNFDWHADFRSYRQLDPKEFVAQEPLIAEEGEIPRGLILIRSGFARLSHRYGDGHRTLAYLGKGQMFGLAELVEHYRTREDVPLECSLRAVGYVDILLIPTEVVLNTILPAFPPEYLDRLIKRRRGPTARNGDGENLPAASIESRTLDFLLDHRFLNGTETMLINLDRCTRCDDCVRACAQTHDNNPRFIRQGPIHDQIMVANACMHCMDPVCLIGCPTGAIGRDIPTGTVRINDPTCIGCATCANSCPFDAIRMVEIRDNSGALYIDDEIKQAVLKATKCDLCADQWGGPACQRACPHDAMVRMDMGNREALASWLGRDR